VGTCRKQNNVFISIIYQRTSCSLTLKACFYFNIYMDLLLTLVFRKPKS